ncbi:MAG: lysophospholipid acyltransferase family protein [Planctomycetes bacterium]|nr:lysophospholipid acyltransferase family protein [Planctomycetota bacterium]
MEWLAVRLAFVPLTVLPGPVLVGGMTLLSRIAYALGGSLRRRAVQLVEARLGLPAGCPEARRVVRGAYDTLLLNAVEPTLLERHIRRGRDIREFVTVEGAEHLQAAQASDRGVIVVTGHFGAWEALAIVMHQLFRPVWVITRQLNNPLLERELVERRRKWVAGRLPKEGSGLRLARVLRQGGTAGLLLDQNAGRQGAILPFLGAPASHHTVAGSMERRAGAVVVPAYLLRLKGRLRFHMLVEPPVQVDPALPAEQAILEITRRLSQSLERQVRAHPGQWMWLHDRWRHAERVLRREAREGPGPPGRTQVASAEGTNGP